MRNEVYVNFELSVMFKSIITKNNLTLALVYIFMNNIITL